MDKAIKHHLNKKIKEKIRLTGGFTFNTWLLILRDGQKVVFRAQEDFYTGGGREIIIKDVLEREKFFYDTVNQKIGRVCPQVYVVDGSLKHYEAAFCIMEYIEGEPLNTLDLCDDIYYKIGELAAQVNSLEIDKNHPYVAERDLIPWEEYMAVRLGERLKPFAGGIITQDEINILTNKMRQSKATKTLSFLHLDMRHVNMIYNNGNIFLLDAENCEFGDPLWEIATIDVAGELTESLLKGYAEVSGYDLNLDSELYNLYKMERQALVLNVFMNEVKSDKTATERHLKGFCELKRRLME